MTTTSKVTMQECLELLLKASADGVESLSDEELALINAQEDNKELRDLLYKITYYLPNWLRQEGRRREKQAELADLSTEDLQGRLDKMMQERYRILQADIGDNLSDSFFEAPAPHSDESVMRAILAERGIE